MAELAWKQIQLAQEHADHASPVEQALIKALTQRYVEHQAEDRTSLDQAYADAMRTVWKKYPDDPDVGSLFAESMMDLLAVGSMGSQVVILKLAPTKSLLPWKQC